MAPGSSPARPGLVIVCGLPGTGKTTLARRLAAERGALRLNPDEWMTALGASLWDSEVRAKVEALQWSLAQDLLRLGHTVVIEWGTWARAERDTLREGARALGAGVELHYLEAPVDELWRRVSARQHEDPPIERRDLEVWAELIEEPDDEEVALYDEPDAS